MSAPFKVAALYVETGGVYVNHDRIDAWDAGRDARTYAGPWPVVAHPPCERWGMYWGGGPLLVGTPKQKKLGDDAGCFAAALECVRKYGGVLEHPAYSHAWAHFGLNKPPRSGGWVAADFEGGWTCCVAQGHYGHPAEKLTWLYARGVVLPSLVWGRCPGRRWLSPPSKSRQHQRKAAAVRASGLPRIPNRLRKATPVEFRNLLLSIAASAMWATT